MNTDYHEVESSEVRAYPQICPTQTSSGEEQGSERNKDTYTIWHTTFVSEAEGGGNDILNDVFILGAE